MLTRATNRSYTCLKCQYRLALREFARIESQNITLQAPRRWQTSAARAVAEDEAGKDESGDPQRDTIENQESKSYYLRRWRPKPTTNIGGDVLGKPAEILVLPPSKRRRKKSLRDVDEGAAEDVIDQEIPEKSKGKPQLRIHEALAQESRPTSRREVLQNIEKIREDAIENAVDGALTEEKWTECLQGLSRGFAKKQLGWYIDENVKALKSTSPQTNIQIQSLTRTQAGTEILSKLWGFTNDAPPRELTGHVTNSVSLGRGGRELILSVDREWRRFLQHVTIEPNSTPGGIDIAGPESWVIKAQSVFESLKRRVCSRTILLPNVYAKALKGQESSTELVAYSMLQELMQKYEIILTKRSEWTAYTFYSERLDKFERDLLLTQTELAAEAENKTATLFLASDLDGQASLMPVYDSTLDSQRSEWYRYSSPQSSSNDKATHRVVDLESDKFQDLIANLKTRFFEKDVHTLKYAFPGKSLDTIGSVTTEISAAIGQALHRSQDPLNTAADDLDVKADTQQTNFLPRIPLLRQFLAKQETHHPSKDLTDVNNPPLVLRFTPSDIQNYPEIEIRATVTVSAIVEMNIESVKLVLPSESAHVAFPTAPTDLKLTHFSYVTIFQLGNHPVQKIYAPLLGQLKWQLRLQDEIAKNPAKLSLNRLLHLDLACLEAAGSAKRGKSPAQVVRYALDKAQLIDQRSYRVPGQDQIWLEHTSYLPLKISSMQETSEVLRVVPNEKASTFAKRGQFEDFVKGAVSVVEMLDDFVTQKTRELVQDNKVQGQVQDGEKKKGEA